MKTIKIAESGFTLIELLVVLSIISVLSAIAIPSFAQYKEKAINAKLYSEMHNLRVAFEVGVNDPSIVVNSRTSKRYTASISSVGSGPEVLTPGFNWDSVTDDNYYLARFNPTCTSATCFRTYVYTANCTTGRQVYHRTYGDGRVLDVDNYSAAQDSNC